MFKPTQKKPQKLFPSGTLGQKAAVYFTLTLILTVIFCGALYIAGLSNATIQHRINNHVLHSVEQFKHEGIYPQIISAQDTSYRLDNFTDTTILQESMLMNTVKDPSTILTNPRLSKTYEDAAYHDRILSLEEAAKTNSSNGYYTYYWIGLRAIIRPLLILFPYQSIRGIIAAIFICLFLAAALSVYRSLGAAFCGAFSIPVICMNIPVVVSEIQYAPCFWLAFLSICALTRIWKNTGAAVMLFFITGACTQYLDFYTFPLMTLGFPLIVLIGLMKPENPRTKLLLAGKCVAAWFAAYGLFWVIRLELVEAFTECGGFQNAISRFLTWTGLTPNERYSQFTPYYSMQKCFKTLLQPHNIFILFVPGCISFVKIIRSVLQHTLEKPSWCYMLVACMPLIWIAVTSRASGNHFWFQYRLLSVFLFSILAFIADLFPRSNSAPVQDPLS